MRRVLVKEQVSGADWEPQKLTREVELRSHGVLQAADQAASAFAKGKRTARHTYRSGRWRGTTEPRLKGNTRVRLVTEGGELQRVQFLMPVHGIFREYGVGRGRLVRTPADWFSRQLAARQERLADLVAASAADKTVHVVGLSSQRSAVGG